MKLKNIFFLSTLFLSSANADVNSDLNKFFNNMNFSGMNYTQGDVWRGQAAGYLVGGGLYARTGVKNIQLASISAPSVNAGCGGIDLYLGSFSFIDGKQLTRFIKNVMSNSIGYAFDLALTTLTPQLKQVKDYIQSLSQAVNDTNFSSCQAAQALVGSVGVNLGASKDYVCNSFGNQNNNFSDWVQSRMECGVGKQANNLVNKSKSNSQYQDLATLVNTNLTWYILDEKTGKTFKDDSQIKELIMTLMGTVIYRDGEVKRVLSSMGKKDITKALLNGGKAEIYVCDEEKSCLNPQLKEITISKNQALNQRVNDLVNEIINKVENDSPELTANEQNFIESTTIPILKYMIDPMSIQTSRILVGDITKHVSYDLLYQYLTSVMNAFNVAAANTDLPENVRNDIADLSKNTYLQLNSIREELSFQENQMLKLEEQMRYLRMQASSNLLSNYLANYDF